MMVFKYTRSLLVGRTLAIYVKKDGGAVVNYLPFLWTIIGIGNT